MSNVKTVNDRRQIKANAIAINTVAYTAGDALGSKWIFPGAQGANGSGVVEQITIVDDASQKAALDIVFFSEDPSATTVTNNSPVTLAAGDFAKAIGWVQIPAANYTDMVGVSIATLTFPVPFTLKSGNRDLYAIVLVRGTPTFASANDISASIIIRKD